MFKKVIIKLLNYYEEREGVTKKKTSSIDQIKIELLLR